VKLLGRLLLVFALLFAQTGSVTHEIWHASSLAVDADSKAPQKSLLCDFHTALSAVLGALDGAHQAVPSHPQMAVAFVPADASAAGRSVLAPRSRAPPALL
jgi:hypothetical protein